MRYEVLTNGLADFQRRFNEQAGITIPLDYFTSSIVTGACSNDGQLVGGWVTAPGRVGRWLAQTPDLGETAGAEGTARVPEGQVAF